MKVVFATGIFPPDIGGPATSVSMLAAAWSKQGHEVAVVTFSDAPPSGGFAHADAALGYEVRRIPRAWPAWKRYPAFLSSLWKATAPDRAAGTRPGPIFAQDAVVSGLPAWLVSRARRRRLVLRIAGDFAWERAQIRHAYRGALETFQADSGIPAILRILREAQRFVYRRADRVIAPSRYLADLLKSWGVAERRIRLIYNGVPSPSAAPAQPRDPLRIVAAARLTPWKNIDVLIKAMPRVLKKFPRASLRIIGDGPELAHLKELASAPMLADHVEFSGRLAPAQVGKELSSGGIHALVSSYEGFSHQLVQGFAHGIPTVASKAGGNAELVEDGKNGLLVEPGDVNGLADALTRLMGDPELARRCAEAARRDLGRFGVERQIEETGVAVLGAPGVRVVLISRDATAADPASRTAARMRTYGQRVDRLRVVCFARCEAVSIDLSPNVHIDAVDVGRIPAPRRLIRAVREAIAAEDATLIVAQDPFEAGLIALIAGRRERVSLVVEEHGGIYLSEHWRAEAFRHRFLRPLGLAVFKRADGLRAVSVKIEQDLHERFPTKPIVRVPVYTEPRACRSTAAPDAFGYVGRFVPQKNLFGLLDAFAIVAADRPSARLLMAGTGPLEDALKARTAELGLAERIEWAAHTENVDALYARIGTLVLASWYEGWARVVPEAMSCGIPVVMTDVGCANEAPRNGIEGYIVPVGERAVMARAMLEISDPAQHALMAAAARRRTETLPEPEALIDRLTEFWKKIAAP